MEKNGINFKQVGQSIKPSVVLFVILRITALFFFVTNVMPLNLRQAFQNGCEIASESMTIRTLADQRQRSLIFSEITLLVLEATLLKKSSHLSRTQNLLKKKNLSLRRKRRGSRNSRKERLSYLRSSRVAASAV